MSININMIAMKRKYDRNFFLISVFCVVVVVLIKSKEKRSLIAVLYIKSMDYQMLE